MIGSSMGAWLMMLVAMERPHRVQSIIGLASAPDFTHRAYARFSPEVILYVPTMPYQSYAIN